MAFLLGLLLGLVSGYALKAIGAKQLIADLRNEIARLRGKQES